MARQQIEPSHPVRTFATLPCWYALDGLLDELKVYDQVLAGKTILEHSTASQPTSAVDLPARVMPSGPPGPDRFGASYVNLEYYPEWDALWRVSSDPDVIVQSGGTRGQYDPTQRGYVVSPARDAAQGPVEVVLKADAEHPAYNPAFIVEHCGDRPATLRVDNEQVSPGRDFLIGHIRRVNDYDLVIWLRMESDRPVKISLATGR